MAFATINKRMERMEGENNSKRIAVQQLHVSDGSKYAVFLRSPSGSRAHFKYLHDSIESATERSREYAANMASLGHLDFMYYVIEIKHRVGIEHGKVVDAALK